MTTPTPSPFAGISTGDEMDALHGISSMLTGTKMLKDNPGVVYALQQAQATPADAQAIDQFMQGLDAARQVRLAEATGQKLVLDDQQKMQLDAMGVPYAHVEYTQQNAAQAAANRIWAESKGAMTAKMDKNGNYVVNSKGQVEAVPTYVAPKDSSSGGGGIFGFFGHVFHDINNDVVKPVGRDVVEPAANALNRGYNYVSSEISQNLSQYEHGPNINGGSASVPDENSTRAQDMKAQGYDPSSFWSRLAFQSSGKAHTDLSSVEEQWDETHPNGLYGMDGTTAVSQALQFNNDPGAYAKSVENDPSNYDASGNLTDAGQEKLKMLNSPEFQALTQRVAAQDASIGNSIANATGLDPVKHPTLYGVTAAGVNLASAFAIDPVASIGSAAKAEKLAQVGIDSLTDTNGIVRSLDPATKGVFASDARRGWLRGIDLAGQIRDANEAGDTVRVAGLTARFNAELPGLAPLLPDFVGTNMIGADRALEAGYAGRDVNTGELILGAGPGIRSLDDATNYIASKYALTRLMNGRAATQASLMPGALSAFGYRRLKGAFADLMTSRSTERAESAYADAVAQAAADPALAQKLIDDGLLQKFEPQADDAVDTVGDNIIADKGFHDLHGDVQRALSGIRAERARDALAEHSQLSGELDDLEARLQELASSGSATPEALAALRDQIQSGRQLLEANETTNAYNVGFLKAVEAEHATLSAQINAPQAGLEMANGAAIKGVPNAPINKALEPDVSYALTYAGKGEVARNLRKNGSPLGDRSALGWASPTAVAARFRLAAQRFTTQLPRNTMIDINDAASSDKIYKLAMTYLNRGDANALRAAWNLGDGGQRKAIISGLIDQLGHAAGLGKSTTGQNILDAAKTAIEDYSSIGDNVVVDGQSLALHAGQTRTTWVLPTFQALQQASRKLGLWEATMGRALTSNMSDVLMSQWKMGALFKPSTVTRNQLEGWLRTALEGKFGDAVKAKALLTTTNRELWESDSEAVRQIASASKAEYERLLADGDRRGAEQIAKSSMLTGQHLGRSAPGQRLAEFAPLALAGRAYRTLMGKTMDAEHVEALLSLGKDELSTALEEYGQQIREADLGTRRLARESGEVAKGGYGPSLARIATRRAMGGRDSRTIAKTEYVPMDVLGPEGADRYENALAMRVNTTPSVARAVIDHLRNPDKNPLESVISAMDDPAIAHQMRLTGWGRYTWDDPVGPARLATSDAERMLGKQEWANKVIKDYRHLLTGQNGQFQEKLADEVYNTGKAPSSDWIQANLKGDERPESVIARRVMAQPQGGIGNLVQQLQDFEGGAYEWFVERPLLRTTSSPVFMANYADARVGLNRFVKDMVENHGISQEAAEYQAKELAIKQAWIKTEQLIDDPGQKTQFDAIARNMFPFSRATQAMIRRWGTGLWQNPAAARRMMLAYEGAVHSGFIYNNAYGEPTFTYPASGVLNEAMRELAKVPGFERLNYFPISSTMTGGAMMAVPGADNPFRMSMGPMLSIPMREIFNLFPDHRAMLDEVDSFINGPIGVGETFSQALPTAPKRFFQAMSNDDRNSAVASAMVGAIANLAAAGKLPPADAPPSVREQFFANLKAQVRSQLMIRAVFGLFAPAAPSTPSEGTSASGADYAFQMQGLGQLSDEYKTILNNVDGDTGRANVIWAAIHPDKLVYEQPKTQATTTGSYLPATDNALNWLESNDGFIKKYQSVAAYFMPENAGKGAFNDRAYNTQIELGLRQRKTPEEFYDQLRVRNAEAVFYPVVAQFDKKIADAKTAGQTQLASQWTNAKSGWERDFKTQNPLFGEKIDAYPDARAVATGQLADLKRMLADGDAPKGDAGLLSQLVQNYDNYDAFVHEHNGQDEQSIAVRHAALQMFNDWANKNIAHSDLVDLYSGVFRTLNTNLVNLDQTTYAGS